MTFEDFNDSGFYLVFPDKTKLLLTPESIRSFADDFLSNPVRVPPHVKKAVDFQACEVCPKQHSGEFCHALRPTLPLIDKLGLYSSHAPVTAVYRDSARNFTAIKTTTVQMALQYVSILSLIHYCEVEQQYRDFFLGVTPLMEFEEVINRIYLNIFWLTGGDKARTRKAIEEFSSQITITVKCQVNRLSLICKNDAFMNAFCNTHLITHFLSGDMDARLRKSLESFREESDALHGEGVRGIAHHR